MKMANFKNGQWLVGCKTSTDFWIPVAAKTLAGAKRCATNEYQVAAFGVLQVAQVMGDGDAQQVVEMSRKIGYGKWHDAP
jgi:hypothetical protein